MNEGIQKYLLSKIVEDIRSRDPFPEYLATALHKHSLSDDLRGAMEERDLLLVLAMASSESLPIAILGISLLRKFRGDASVKQFLRTEWSKATEYERKWALMPRLLDDEHLDLTLHEEMFAFVKDNFPRFLVDSRRWYEGADCVLDGCRSRLNDSSFPLSKSWVYLCCAMGSDDRNGIADLLYEYSSSTHVFTSVVANEMLVRLAAENASR